MDSKGNTITTQGKSTFAIASDIVHFGWLVVLRLNYRPCLDTTSVGCMAALGIDTAVAPGRLLDAEKVAGLDGD